MNAQMERVAEYLSVAWDYAKDYFLENTGLKVLALLITGVLWLSVASRPITQIAFSDVDIVLKNLPEHMKVTNSDAVYARVYLAGPRDVMDTLRPSDLTVMADLTGVEPGVRVIELTLDASPLPAGVEERSIDPRTVRVTIERIEIKEVPIAPRFEGALPDGYELYEWRISPPTIRIEGAESLVKEIEQVLTETISLMGKTSPFSRSVAIDIDSPNLSIHRDDPREVRLEAIVGEERRERVFDSIPVTLVGAPTGARPVPRTVRVTLLGAASVIGDVNADDITVTVIYDDSIQPPVTTLSATLSGEFTGRVAVKSIDPPQIRVR